LAVKRKPTSEGSGDSSTTTDTKRHVRKLGFWIGRRNSLDILDTKRILWHLLFSAAAAAAYTVERLVAKRAVGPLERCLVSRESPRALLWPAFRADYVATGGDQAFFAFAFGTRKASNADLGLADRADSFNGLVARADLAKSVSADGGPGMLFSVLSCLTVSIANRRRGLTIIV
jgi:hypothetical protein